MKIAIIGIGSVGAAVATAVATTGLAREIVLLDANPLRAAAAADDLGHASAFSYDIKISAAREYRGLRGSDIVIIAAGANQKPGETRTDLLQKNVAVISDIIPRVMKNVDAKKVKLIIATNPLDVMVMVAQKLSKLPASRVIGTGTMLDSARLRTILGRRLGVSTRGVHAYVLGEHGDSSVVGWSAASVGGLPLDDFCRQTRVSLPAAARKQIEFEVHNAAYEIIKGRGATWDGIGAAAADLVRCIANDERRILTVSTLDGKLAMSLPRIVGADGIIATLHPKLSATENAALRKSGNTIRKNFESI